MILAVAKEPSGNVIGAFKQNTVRLVDFKYFTAINLVVFQVQFNYVFRCSQMSKLAFWLHIKPK